MVLRGPVCVDAEECKWSEMNSVNLQPDTERR